VIGETPKKLALDRIRANIEQTGHHVYMVLGGAIPRFAYTIGISESVGIELILAGAFFYLNAEVAPIVNNIAAQLKADRGRQDLTVEEHGNFTLRTVHVSWAKRLMLGVLDYYQVREMSALQIVPDDDHWTIDVPDMSVPLSITSEPIWQWLQEPWLHPVPENSVAATDLGALRGERITEAKRWEDDEWEVFAGYGPDLPKNQMREVPLGTLLAVDESLVPVIHLAIGEGIVREVDPVSEWQPMQKGTSE
jgi:hypothetical protein